MSKELAQEKEILQTEHGDSTLAASQELSVNSWSSLESSKFSTTSTAAASLPGLELVGDAKQLSEHSNRINQVESPSRHRSPENQSENRQANDVPQSLPSSRNSDDGRGDVQQSLPYFLQIDAGREDVQQSLPYLLQVDAGRRDAPRADLPRVEAPEIPAPEAAPRPGAPVAPAPEAAPRPGAPVAPAPEAAPKPGAPVAPAPEAAPRPGAPVAPAPEAAPRPGAPVAPAPEAAPRPEAPAAPVPDVPAPRVEVPAPRPEVPAQPENNNRIVEGPRGSRVEYDRATDRPVFMQDENGNQFQYEWANGPAEPSRVTVNGPRTGNVPVVYEPSSTGDRVIGALTDPRNYSYLDSIANLNNPFPRSRERGFVGTTGGREQPGSATGGVGGGGSVTGSLSLPVQREVGLRVNSDGSLSITQGPETWNGSFYNRSSTTSYNMDGSVRYIQRVGGNLWTSPSSSARTVDRNGNLVR